MTAAIEFAKVLLLLGLLMGALALGVITQGKAPDQPTPRTKFSIERMPR